ncbi:MULTISPECIES: hypothetical protein [Bacillales]|uniref:Transposase n=1 Tax=Cytobacillus mangrovibacter TaxID=3299024 RepID=A0ABW6K2B6_9BACI|nr:MULTISPECIES: hypothetical protein [Bacillales]EAR66131.1 hypothetical protein B14911_10367 [Bacillus sp. NRRL B-14911]MBD0732695.1 hypothetical protein [Bacillus cereus]MEB7773344.1 hypothetical protein [Kurthia gibsonii]PGT88763.1 hypothetical protein COD11_05470 [Bacillus sp. AFS040349]
MTIKNLSHTLTLEQAARVLEKFRIVFTVEGVKTKIQLQQLTAISKPYEDRRYSGYPYLVLISSLVDYLKDKGYTDEDIMDALPDGIEI